MSLLDNLSESTNRKQLVGIVPARLTEIYVDDKLTASNSKRIDFKFNFKFEDKDYNSKFSFWISDKPDVTKTGKVKFIDEKGVFADSWLENDLNNYATKTKLSERKLNLERCRPAYPAEGYIISFLKYVFSYRKDSKQTIVNIDGNEGIFLPDVFNGTDAIINGLNEKLKVKDIKIAVMVGVNDNGYSVVYPLQFDYASNYEKDFNKLSGEKLEKAQKTLLDSQTNFAKIADRYKNSVLYSLKAKARLLNNNESISDLTLDQATEALNYHKETDFFYAGLLTEYTDNLKTTDLAIDFAGIRKSVLSENNLISSQNIPKPSATSVPF
jgi:hypothetical protein